MNQTATRVEVRWNVVNSPSLTEDQRERLIDKLSARMDSKGTVRVVADERRSQLRNREAAIKRLNDLVREALKKPKPRKKTRPPASANIKRLEEKRKRGELKRQRRPINRDE